MTAPPTHLRAPLIGDAAMEILAAGGSHGLTHRAVDRHLGWPEGSTSRYFRTRDALLTAAVNRLLEVDLVHVEHWEAEQASSPTTTRDDVARILEGVYDSWTSRDGSVRHIARYELSLEGRRRPAVHSAILAGRRPLNDSVARLLEAISCTASTLHATSLVSYLDGLVHDHLLHPEVAARPCDVLGLFTSWLRQC